MASRPLIIASLIGASIGVPYFTSRTPSGDKPTGNPPATATSMPATTPAPSQTTPPPVAAAPLSSIQQPGESTRFNSVDQFLRFDVTKEWVYRHWNRKSTGPTDVGLLGVRVPLVMGTQMTALAGSLTYYFNSHGQAEHISFRGRTADTTPLVNFLTRTYQFQRVEGPVGEQIYQVTRRGRVQSELRTRPVSVLNSDSPHSSVAVELELARPGSRRFLPPRGPFLQIPQVASPPVAPSTNSESAAAQSAGDAYLDKVRFATPQEEGQVLWKRWPN
ncbi:MAG: DUF6690 family protein [Pirellulales bacterium]